MEGMKADGTKPASPQEDGLGVRTAKLFYPIFVGQLAGFFITAATFVVVTRLLGPASYGIYVFAFGFSALVNGVAAFGFGAYFSSQLPEHVYKKNGEVLLRDVNTGYLITIVVGLLLTLIGIGLSGFVAGLFHNVGISPFTLMLTSSQIIFLMVSMISVNALIGMSRAGLSAIVNVLVDIIQFVLSIVLTLMYGVNGAIAAILIGYMFGAVVGTYFVFRAVAKYIKIRFYIPLKSEIKKTLDVTLPIAANNFLNTGMQNFSILFLGLFVTTAALGNYGAATKGLSLISTMTGAIGLTMLPAFTTARAMKRSEEVNSAYNTIIRLTLMLLLPAMVYIGAMAVPALYLLVSTSFTTAPLYLSLMAFGSMIGLIGSYISNLLISAKHTKSVLVINLVSAIAQFILIVAIVPYTKVIGAIVAIFFVGNIIEMIMFIEEEKKRFDITFEYRKIAKLYACNILLAVILVGWFFLSNPYSFIYGSTFKYMVQLAVGLVLSLVFYPLFLVTLHAMDMNDITSMRQATKKLGRVSRIIESLFSYSEHIYNVVERE